MALRRITTLILPYAKTQKVYLLPKVAPNDFKNYFAIMLADGAGWRRSKDLWP